MQRAVIVDATRSALVDPGSPDALGRIPAAGLLGQLLRGLLTRARIDPELVDEVVVAADGGTGACALGEQAWESALPTGMRSRRPKVFESATTVEGLREAVARIEAGLADVVVVAGIDRVTAGVDRAGDVGGTRFAARADELARMFGISADTRDQYRRRSVNRARLCRDGGDFAAEITPVVVDFREGVPIVVDTDRITDAATADADGPGAAAAEGAAAAVLCSEEWARAGHVDRRATVVAHTGAMSRPDVLDGPINATRELLDATDSTVRCYDHCELDESAAAVPTAWTLEFDAEPRLLNPRGGALALGRADASAGCRMLATMLGALDATGGRRGLIVGLDGDGHAWAAAFDTVR